MESISSRYAIASNEKRVLPSVVSWTVVNHYTRCTYLIDDLPHKVQRFHSVDTRYGKPVQFRSDMIVKYAPVVVKRAAPFVKQTAADGRSDPHGVAWQATSEPTTADNLSDSC